MRYISLIILLFYIKCGNMLTIFQPCGSNMDNFIRCQKFENLNDNLWRCFLNLQFYTNLVQPTVVQITYFDQTTLVASFNKIGLHTQEGGMTSMVWDITALEGIKTYVFDVRPGANSNFPIIKSIVINGYYVCNINGNFSPPGVESRKFEILSLNAANNEPQCGERKRKFVNLLLNSDEAEPSQWPWHVALFMSDNEYKNSKYICGGSLLARNIVITVAHCVTKYNSIVEARRMHAYVGVTDLTNINSTDCQSSHVKEIIRHPLYSPHNNYADIAVLKLYYCLTFTDYVQPICLVGGPNKSHLHGYYGTVVGFGKTENDTLSNVLKYGEVQLQSDATCYAFDRTHYSNILNDYNFCAGNGPNSSVTPCNGDSGSGFVIPHKLESGSVRWSIRGMVSTTIPVPGKTCDPRVFVVYTDLTAYYQWILHVTGLNPTPFNSRILSKYG